MKKVSYLIAPLVILALFVFGCSQESPTSAGESEGTQKVDAPAVSSESVTYSAEAMGNPIGNCCPEGFDLVEVGTLHPADRNGDANVCRKILNGNTLNIDNNAIGECEPLCPEGTIPPDCLPDPDL